MVRHFLLQVQTPAAARALLGRLVSGDEQDTPQITTAETWQVGFAPGPGDNPQERPRYKPDYCLNVGLTWPGLVALEVATRVPTLSFKSFGAFTDGAAKRAERVGYTGLHAPQHWLGGFGTGADLSLSRLNHRLPGCETHPEVVQGATACHHPIADALLPQADPVFDDPTTLDTTVDMLDAQPAVVQRLMRPLLRQR
jgi:hypothetical protein